MNNCVLFSILLKQVSIVDLPCSECFNWPVNAVIQLRTHDLEARYLKFYQDTMERHRAPSRNVGYTLTTNLATYPHTATAGQTFQATMAVTFVGIPTGVIDLRV